MSPEERFARLVEAVRTEPCVSHQPVDGGRRHFGANAIKVGGKIFAMLIEGRLVVKLPKSRVDAFVDGGRGERLSTDNRRFMKEWLHLAPGAEEEWTALAVEAMEYVSRPEVA